MCICYLKTIFVSWNTNLIVQLHRFGSLKHKFAKLWVSKFVFWRTNLISTNLWFQNTNLTVFWGNLCLLTFVFLYLRFHVCFLKHKFVLFKNANNNIQNANISKKGKIWNHKFVFSYKTNLLFFPYICSNSPLWWFFFLPFLNALMEQVNPFLFLSGGGSHSSSSILCVPGTHDVPCTPGYN